jgi:hypothetical protein
MQADNVVCPPLISVWCNSCLYCNVLISASFRFLLVFGHFGFYSAIILVICIHPFVSAPIIDETVATLVVISLEQ